MGTAQVVFARRHIGGVRPYFHRDSGGVHSAEPGRRVGSESVPLRYPLALGESHFYTFVTGTYPFTDG